MNHDPGSPVDLNLPFIFITREEADEKKKVDKLVAKLALKRPNVKKSILKQLALKKLATQKPVVPKPKDEPPVTMLVSLIDQIPPRLQSLATDWVLVGKVTNTYKVKVKPKDVETLTRDRAVYYHQPTS